MCGGPGLADYKATATGPRLDINHRPCGGLGGAWEQVPRRSVCVHIGSAGLNLLSCGAGCASEVASVSGPPVQLSSGPCNVQARLTGACEDRGGPCPGGHTRHGWQPQGWAHRLCCWKLFCGNRASHRISTLVLDDGRAATVLSSQGGPQHSRAAPLRAGQDPRQHHTRVRPAHARRPSALWPPIGDP